MKNSVDTIATRHEKILSILKEKKEITTEQLANDIGVSLSTIRRDLNILEEKNDVIRKYGYCIYNEVNHNYDETGPETIKKQIGRAVKDYIRDYNTVFINSSSTALGALDYFTAKHLTIVTNNLKVAYSPHDNEYNYILTGGELRFPKEVLVGDIATNTITSMNADVCVIGCSGISIENGVTTKIFHEAKINELMINQTFECRILVADHRKVGKTSKFKISDISIFDYLITDKYCPNDMVQKIEKLGVSVIQVN
ncbi:DeoR/GlpR family DNA-binding transcription regulator [Vagococcus sp. JNUCC 83]